MFVYRSTEFQEEVEELGLGEAVDKLTEWIERDVHTQAELVGRLDPIVPYWKERSGKDRMVGVVRTIDGTDVFCWLAAFQRKDPDYESLCDDPREWGAKNLEPRATVTEVGAWLRRTRARLGREAAARQQAPRLPDTFDRWLTPATSQLPGWEEDDVLVFESPLWNRRIGQQQYRDYWTDFYNTIERSLEEWNQATDVADGVATIAPTGNGNDTDPHIVVARLRLKEPAADVLFLVAPFLNRPTPDQIDETVQDTAPNLQELVGASKNGGLVQDDVARLATRTYPALLLADRDAWRDLEFHEDEGSLALSLEEEALLEDVYTLGTDRGLPLFINGRAGSGKSTMLTYLFAGYCFATQAHQLPGVPLYLTYNDELLGLARENVKALLRAACTKHATLTGDTATADRVRPEDIDPWFASFRQFLLARIPDNVRERFRRDRHITFHFFKEAFLSGDGRLPPLRMPETHRWSPELCWYVIRTLIKGYQSGQPMTPEDYAEIPRRDRVIDHETFAEIFNTVWARWYEKHTREGEFWDDQDLVAAALDSWDPSMDGDTRITAVFCDEAQDFTRQEIRFLLRLSMFSRFDLRNRYVGALPFAFAGDPLQTLNPTGFRWASVQAAFHDELLAPLQGSAQVDLTMTELANNYRSCKPIVELVNSIQLWRCTLFGLTAVHPQRAWDDRDATVPRKFLLGRNLEPSDLDQVARATTILLPCEEGQELEFVESDPELRRLAAFKEDIDEGRRPKNVYSAILAKGLDFDRVILYKFGDHAPDGLWQHQQEQTRGRFRAEYFLNKLYVGASRARTHLFIIDTSVGDETLWGRWETDAHVGELLESYEGGERWRDLIRPLPLAPPASAEEMVEDDPRALAEHLETSGRHSREPEYLRSAAGYYEILEDSGAAERCLALALKFEGRLLEAGRRFAGCGLNDEAWDCFWDARDWNELSTWFEHADARSREKHQASHSLVRFLAEEHSTPELLLEVCAQAAQRVEDGDSLQWLEDVWTDIAPTVAARVEQATTELDQDGLEQLATHLATLGHAGFTSVWNEVGACYFAADDLARAARAWETASSTDHTDYFLAKAAITPAPAKLRYLARARAPERIVEAWNQADRPREREWMAHVAPALERLGDHAGACGAFLALGDPSAALRAFERVSPLDEHFTDYLGRLTRLLATVDTLDDDTAPVRALAQLLRRCRRNVQVPELLDFANTALTKIAESSLATTGPAELPSAPVGMASLIQLVTTTDGWEEHVDPLLVGAALEIVGIHVDALRFYEGFIDHPEIGSRARHRWLAVKQLQLEHERQSRGHAEAAERIRRQRAKRAHDWGFREADSFPRLPQLPSSSPADRETDEQEEEKAPSSQPRRVVGSLEFLISKDERTVGIIDQDSAMATQVDVNTRTVHLRDGPKTADGASVSFPFGDDYVITISFDDRQITVANEADDIHDDWTFSDRAP